MFGFISFSAEPIVPEATVIQRDSGPVSIVDLGVRALAAQHFKRRTERIGSKVRSESAGG